MNPYSLKELEPKPSVYTKFHHYSTYKKILIVLEKIGLEPITFCMQNKHSTNWVMSPQLKFFRIKWDLNPRYLKNTLVFKTNALNRSAIYPKKNFGAMWFEHMTFYSQNRRATNYATLRKYPRMDGIRTHGIKNIQWFSKPTL